MKKQSLEERVKNWSIQQLTHLQSKRKSLA